MWKCKYCGMDNDYDGKFCNNCGSPRKFKRTPISLKVKENKLLVIGALIFLMIITIFSGIYIYSTQISKVTPIPTPQPTAIPTVKPTTIPTAIPTYEPTASPSPTSIPYIPQLTCPEIQYKIEDNATMRIYATIANPDHVLATVYNIKIHIQFQSTAYIPETYCSNGRIYNEQGQEQMNYGNTVNGGAYLKIDDSVNNQVQYSDLSIMKAFVEWKFNGQQYSYEIPTITQIT